MKKVCICLVLLLLLLPGCSRVSETEAPPELAEALGEKYGIEVLVSEEAAREQPWDYEFLPETDGEILSDTLMQMDLWLQNYPKGMVKALSKDCGGLRICIVRKIQGKEGAGSLSEVKGLQFEREDGGVSIVLALRRQQTLYHELCHVIEDFVIPRSPAWDHWEALNPEEFRYDLDFKKNTLRGEEDEALYLREGSRSFVDLYSMSFPREDRARIMEYAMMTGNEELFASPILQEKLRVLSLGIREAFSLREDRALLWEQYLKP